MKHSYELAAAVAVVACVNAFIVGGLLGAKSASTPTPALPSVANGPSEPTRPIPPYVPSNAIRCLKTATSGSVFLRVEERSCFSHDDNEIEVIWRDGQATRVINQRRQPPRRERTTFAAARPFVAMLASLVDQIEGTSDCVGSGELTAKVRWQCGTEPVQEIELADFDCGRGSTTRIAGLRALIHAHLDEPGDADR